MMASNTAEISVVICPADVTHCRQTEASILPFDDGRLFLGYTDFYAGLWRDGGPGRIMGKWSHDEGETWSEPFLVQENIGKMNVMEASLLRLPSGRVLLSFMQKDSEGDPHRGGGVLHSLLKVSDDECATWSGITQITEGDEYWCSTNDRLLRLRNGRILLPSSVRALGCHVWLSDDDGLTWRRSTDVLPPPEGHRYAEPTVVELADGTVAMFIRTSTGNIHIAHSLDSGDHWELHSNWGPAAPFAPCMVRRVPDSDDLLLIWTNHSIRSNLTAAVSRDRGETWDSFRLLEAQEDWPLGRSHTYPSLTFLHGNAHMTYWETHHHEQAGRLFHLVYRRLPISWFYERPSRRPPVYKTGSEERDASTTFDGEQRTQAV